MEPEEKFLAELKEKARQTKHEDLKQEELIVNAI